MTRARKPVADSEGTESSGDEAMVPQTGSAEKRDRPSEAEAEPKPEQRVVRSCLDDAGVINAITNGQKELRRKPLVETNGNASVKLTPPKRKPRPYKYRPRKKKSPEIVVPQPQPQPERSEPPPQPEEANGAGETAAAPNAQPELDGPTIQDQIKKIIRKMQQINTNASAIYTHPTEQQRKDDILTDSKEAANALILWWNKLCSLINGFKAEMDTLKEKVETLEAAASKANTQEPDQLCKNAAQILANNALRYENSSKTLRYMERIFREDQELTEDDALYRMSQFVLPLLDTWIRRECHHRSSTQIMMSVMDTFKEAVFAHESTLRPGEKGSSTPVCQSCFGHCELGTKRCELGPGSLVYTRHKLERSKDFPYTKQWTDE